MEYSGYVCCCFVPLLVFCVVGMIPLLTRYNQLVSSRETVVKEWSQIDVQLKRRHELIPNVTRIAERAGMVETQTLVTVTQARTAAMQARGVGERANAEERLTSLGDRLFFVMEAYPELKSDQRFADLQASWTDSENRLAERRTIYNNAVQQYNTALGQVPSNLVGVLFLFPKAKYFDADDEYKSAVRRPPSA